MLLLLRLGPVNICSHHQGYVRIIKVKGRACLYDLPEDVYYY